MTTLDIAAPVQREPRGEPAGIFPLRLGASACNRLPTYGVSKSDRVIPAWEPLDVSTSSGSGARLSTSSTSSRAVEPLDVESSTSRLSSEQASGVRSLARCLASAKHHPSRHTRSNNHANHHKLDGRLPSVLDGRDRSCDRERPADRIGLVVDQRGSYRSWCRREGPVMSERACTAHADTPIEAETYVDTYGLTYLVLRCPRPTCGRPTGERLVRKVKP